MRSRPGKSAAAVGLRVDALGHSAHDSLGQRPVRMRDRDDTEVLILQPDASARPRDPDHLARDAERIGNVQDDRDGQRGVEAARGKGQARAVGDAQGDARAARHAATERARPSEQAAAQVDAHDLAAAPDQPGKVADDDAGAAAHLEHAGTG